MSKTNRFNWRALLYGVILIIGSVIALNNPAATFATLAIILGISIVVRGVMLIFAYFRIKNLTSLRFKISLILGILLAIIGVILLLKPGFATDFFGYFVAFWLIFDAISNLLSAKYLRPFGTGLFVFDIILNVLLLVSGVLLVLNPAVFGLTVSLIVGVSMMVSGIAHILTAFFDSDPYW